MPIRDDAGWMVHLQRGRYVKGVLSQTRKLWGQFCSVTCSPVTFQQNHLNAWGKLRLSTQEGT